MHVRQSKIATAVTECQLRVVQSHQMQNRGMQVVNVHSFFHCMDSDVVRGSISQSPFDAAARHPDRESGVMVVPSLGSLSGRCATEFPTPKDQGFFEHSSRFQIL